MTTSLFKAGTAVYIRHALLSDIPALMNLENNSFTGDKLSRRQFRWMLKQGHCSLLIAFVTEDDVQAAAGYILTLFHRGTSLARIYSVAVDPAFRGQKVGQTLLQAAEQAAIEHECMALRLEVRPDNPAAISLYERNGYRQFGHYEDYYEDHARALRFQKRIRKPPQGLKLDVPYYQQTLPFTCGPASLLMAMKALSPEFEMSRLQELQIWREATSIFMTTGHGGCGPRGLALAAWQRGFAVELWINRDGPLFIHGVRKGAKKEVLELVHQAFSDQLTETDVLIHPLDITQEALTESMARGGVPLILISSWGFSRQKSPHWVVITAMDDHYIYLHDPEVDEEDNKTLLDTQHVPVPRRAFSRMSRFGKDNLRTAVILFKRKES